MTRPSRIDQIIPSIIEHDAVSNHTFAAQRLLQEMGFASEIYASIIGPGCDGRVHALSDFVSGNAEEHWVLYQSSIGSPAAEVFAKHPGIKLLDYHNITPAALVERWIPPLADEARLGREQLISLAPLCTYAFADSSFNESELHSAGFTATQVVPVLIDVANYETAPDAAKIAELNDAKVNGGADWLFVGQVGAHKAQHDVVRAFACYRKIYDEKARLHIVGREMGSTYRDALQRFVRSIGLQDAVHITGGVPAASLTAYYETADVFVCCSNHEGFCVPVIESMAHGLPVVAYSVAAVTETVGDGGVLLPTKEPALVASAVHEVLTSDFVRKNLIESGKRQAAKYTIQAAQDAFRTAISTALSLAS